ncbi:M16 family metallopeptidase [Sphingomonas japonica]|uniref:Zn-dependent peptidase n=2 Tax=Sphingomonas japonica TaxID=511662 RepID=A0ABX0U086_9SPHN|nr:pitrilysin family protein [Sphingomonas japonica]NIJ22691.1 putative Zn-dependent peptidase [Sphingomonas japonica]
MIFAAALLAGIAAPAIAQQFPPAPPIGEPKPFNVPAYESYTLANGMEVTLIPYGVTPKTVVSLRIYAGAVDEGGDTWLSDLTADMMKQAAGNRDAAAIATAAADMGGGLSTGVSGDVTSVSMNVLSEHAADAIALVGDVARRPAFPAGELARVKGNWSRQLAQALADPGSLADAALARTYYGTQHPYGSLFPSAAKLDGYTIDQVKRFYADNFGAKRARLYIAGKFDAASVKAAVEAAFGDWKAGAERRMLPPTPVKGPQLVLVDRPGAPQTTLRIAYPAPAPGTTGDIPLRVTDALLGGSFSSRITRNIREDKGYTYSPYSSYDHTPYGGRWTFNADVTTAVTGASLSEVFKEMRTLQTTPPPAEEATGMGRYLAGLFAIQNATAPALVGTLAERDALGLPDNWLQNYVPAVLAVSPQAMTQAAEATLPIDQATLVVVGDLATVEPQLKALPELKGATFKRVTVP